MKTIRLVALGVALVIGSAAVASAQGTPQQGVAGRGARPNLQLKDISLTAEQHAKIEEINKKYAPEMLAIHDAMQSGGDRTEGMKKMNDLRVKVSPEIRAVLTSEQQAIYDKNTADMKARMEAMTKQPPPFER